MAKEHRFSVPAHPNVYDKHGGERNLDIIFTEPEGGGNENTGLLLLVAGFGETMNSPKYEEARAYFSDHHNMFTVQCGYFGQAFMQDSLSVQYSLNLNMMRQVLTSDELDYVYDGSNIDIDKLFQVGSNYPIHLDGEEVLNETKQEFNDMGIMQAIDQLTAIFAVEAILKDNERIVNKQRVHAYGQGHGAYLIYLCNVLAPKRFTCIVDNSAWLVPTYLKSGRNLRGNYGKMDYSITFNYLAASMPFDKELQHLASVYKSFRNQARIIAYHGTDDHLTNIAHKKAFCQSVRLCSLKEVTATALVDSVIQSNGHGVGANFLRLYDYSMEQYAILGEVIHDSTTQTPTRIDTKLYRYNVDFSAGLPLLTRQEKVVQK
ncbi:DUF2920 family protein [Paenibacillus sp. LjRoot56]|uniref:DUF2920 family protein n=1 Tax=Paenibacillus sp. LjRoot56 TaxID=3342333 RepID=UPI003ECFEF58